VTGGSRGIGRGIVKALAKEGAKVGFVYRSKQAEADALVQEVAAAGGTALAIQGDVADPATPAAAFEKLKAAVGERVDILVNNAGVSRDGLFVRMSEDDWMTVINTNLNGLFRFTQAAAALMMRQRSGRIINISSVAAHHVNAGQANYVASKGAVNSL